MGRIHHYYGGDAHRDSRVFSSHVSCGVFQNSNNSYSCRDSLESSSQVSQQLLLRSRDSYSCRDFQESSSQVSCQFPQNSCNSSLVIPCHNQVAVSLQSSPLGYSITGLSLHSTYQYHHLMRRQPSSGAPPSCHHRLHHSPTSCCIMTRPCSFEAHPPLSRGRCTQGITGILFSCLPRSFSEFQRLLLKQGFTGVIITSLPTTSSEVP